VALQSGTAAVAELVVAGIGSAGPDSPYTAIAGVAEGAAAAQKLAAGPDSQCIVVALALHRSLLAGAPVHPENHRAGHTAAAAVVVVAGQTEAGQVGRCCRPLSMSWTRRTWWAGGRESVGDSGGAHTRDRNVQRRTRAVVSGGVRVGGVSVLLLRVNRAS
jgi:hypothetical protein